MSDSATIAAEKHSSASLKDLKAHGTKITMLTAYDFPTAQFVEAAGVDIALVGDSLGNAVYGFRTTRDVTMELMLPHVAAVRRGAPNTHIVADMPFQSFDTPELAVANARRFVDVGADSVKIEGALTDVVEALRDAGIEVMGHVGLLPQTAKDFKARGRTQEEADAICAGARALERAGCFSLVLEHMPLGLAQRITEELSVPTIGIGAGPHCDGQVLVIHDMLGFFFPGGRFKPPFVKRYAAIGEIAVEACRRYAEEVRSGAFPDLAHSTE